MQTIIRNVKNDPFWIQLKDVRKEIFVHEQGLEPILIEDIHDGTCTHILFTNHQKIIASCRVRQEGDTAYIERVSVVQAYRKQSMGRMLIDEALQYIQTSGSTFVTIIAQSRVGAMYEKFGFQPHGCDFEYCGTSHIKMIKTIGWARFQALYYEPLSRCVYGRCGTMRWISVDFCE